MNRWITSTLRSRICAFINLAGQMRHNFEPPSPRSNSTCPTPASTAFNSRIQRRGYGYRSVDSLTAMIYICIGDVTLTCPAISASCPP